MRILVLGFAVSIATLGTASSSGAEVLAAVAANFSKPAGEIAAAFTAKTGDTVSFSFGSTGALYVQVTQGAPFEMFLSADSLRPAQAVREGYGLRGTLFTYAVGKLVLYSPSLDLTDGEAVLKNGKFQHLAIADPKTAPYGTAAMETLQKLGLGETLRARLVTGENITQAQQFVDSGNAELGFLALSQVMGRPAAEVWRVPAEDYSPILQDAVLLKAGADDPAAKAFLQFLRSDEAKTILANYGYGTN